MKNKIILIDPKAAILNFLSSLSMNRWELEEIHSQTCQFDLAIDGLDLSTTAIALSGSDQGIALTHCINHQLNHIGNINASILYNKIAQYEFIKKHHPTLVFNNTQIFQTKSELDTYLLQSDQEMIIRPDTSSINGSAVLYKNNYHTLDNDLDKWFHLGKKAIAHPFIAGDSFFINGIVINGELFITDAWKCFNQIANQRNILTSVISLPKHEETIVKISPTLQALCNSLSLHFSPIHFEIVITKKDNQLKIVKIVPRFATEPLPTLCGLANIKNQIETFKSAIETGKIQHETSTLRYYAADYSFIVRNRGHLKSIKHFDRLVKLKSYYQTYYKPAIGAFLPLTVCGSSYGLTILLRNNDKQQLLEDLATCQQINKQDIFDTTQSN